MKCVFSFSYKPLHSFPDHPMVNQLLKVAGNHPRSCELLLIAINKCPVACSLPPYIDLHFNIFALLAETNLSLFWASMSKKRKYRELQPNWHCVSIRIKHPPDPSEPLYLAAYSNTNLVARPNPSSVGRCFLLAGLNGCSFAIICTIHILRYSPNNVVWKKRHPQS
jgi:hypothetical protein